MAAVSGCLERNDASRQPTSGSRKSQVSEGCKNKECSWSAGGAEALKNTEGAAGLNIRVTTAYGDITARSL
ncbi:hypothetical protein ACFY3M_25250 [Streptomyces mirabilis]|uniref:hypothetical protein n=1 Tax=Streptomyces mirabilis TaxID=68239 RepID=UPI0036A45744